MRRRGIGRVGRPGVVGTVARTAVIAGTATAVSNKVSQHQAEKAYQQAEAQAYEAQQAAPPPPPPAPAPAGGQDDVVAQIQQLAQLKDQGILTEEEFAAKKAQLLGI
jgi:hypothetical protein